MDQDLFESQRQQLEDSFFLKEDKALIENLKKMQKIKETKESLREASGITDSDVLAKLVELDIRPETLAAVTLLPLIEVAWADGEVQEKEKAAIQKAAEKSGIKAGSVELQLLDSWMNHKPTSDVFEAWEHYTKGLCSKLTSAEASILKKEIIDHATSVAEAFGGFIGLNKISNEEKKVIERLSKSFTC